MSFFQAIGLGMKLIGGMQAARAQEQASKDNAEAMVTDRIRGEAQAAQQQVARYQQYFDDIATNEAMLLKNRDFDQSVKAFFDEQKTVTFDDNEYDIQDLTPRAIEAFNVLFKGQQNLNNLAMDVKLTQASIAALNGELKTILKEDKIKPKVKIETEKKE